MKVGVKDYGSPDDAIWKSHPTLARYLFKGSWDGITPRVAGRLAINVTPTGLAVTITMPSEAQARTESVDTFADLLDVLEDAIVNRPRGWREVTRGPGAQKLREDRKKLRDTRK